MARPTRVFPAAVSHGMTVFCLAGLGLIAGVTWMYVTAAVLAVGVTYGIVQAVRGAGRAQIIAIDSPPMAIAGEPTELSVTTSCPQTVVFELLDGAHSIGRWLQPAGRTTTAISVAFGSRGIIDRLHVVAQCAGPFGTWVWQGTSTVALRESVAVGAAPLAAAPLPASLTPGDGSGHVEHRSGEPGALLGLRPWADGDPIGWVHWPSAARSGQVLVRQWQPPARVATEVELDRHTDPALAEQAAGIAAGRIEAALASHGEIRLVTPAAGGGSTTSAVRDRWAAARAIAEADLPRHIEPTESTVATQIETSRAARFAVSAVAAIACATTARATNNSPVLWALALVVIPALTALRLTTGRRARWALHAAVGVLAVATTIRFLGAVAAAGPTGVFAIGAALVEVLGVLVVIRATTGGERRVLRFAIGASAALIGFSAALRFDPLFPYAIAAWLATAATAFVCLHRSDARASCTTTPQTRPQSGRERGRRAGGTVGAAVLVVGLAFIALVVVPIPSGPVRLLSPSKIPEVLKVPSSGGLAARGADGQIIESTTNAPVPSAAFGYSAFMSSFDLSQRGRPGNEVVMRVRAPAPDFWRAQTFETFDGRQWTVSPDIGVSRNGPVISVPRRPGDAGQIPTDQLVQTYMLEQDMPNLLFAASRPTEVLLDTSVWIRPDGALRADTVLAAGTEYTVVSERAQVTAETLRMQGSPEDLLTGTSWSPPWGERYLQLPDTTTDRVRELTRSITDPYPSVYDKIRAIESWLAANVEYDLAAPVPPEGDDAVDHFLFESKQGFCEQIATTLVIMLRSIGVPARVAAGYIPGERDPFAGVWVVREGDAHAWAEVWFPVTGWQAFDPTASVPFAGDTAGLRSVGAPIIAAVFRFLAGLAPTALVVLLVAALVSLAVRWLRIAIHSRRDPAWAAQRRFQQICHRLNVPVDKVDTNETLAQRLAEQHPRSREPALRAAAAIDAATFGAADSAPAQHAIRELAASVRSG